MHLISSYWYTKNSPPPSRPVQQPKPSDTTASTDSGSNPFADLIATYSKQPCYDASTRNNIRKAMQQQVDSTFLENPDLNFVRHQVVDLGLKEVGQFTPMPPTPPMPDKEPTLDLNASTAASTDIPSEDLFLDFSASSATSAEEAKARYAAALKSGVSLADLCNSLTGPRSEHDPLQNAEHPLLGGAESADINTITTSGTVLTLITPTRHDEKQPANYSMRVTSKSGVEITLPMNEDAHINEYENGYVSLYYPTTGKRITYDAAGQPTDAQDVENWGKSGQDIIINTTGENVDTGDGDDIIFNTVNNANITGSNGNKTVYMLGKENTNCTLDLGDGNNTILGSNFTNSNFILGSGSNSLMTMRVDGGSITGGGKTSIAGKGFMKVNIDLPNGNSTINVDFISKCTAKLQGNNQITSKEANYSTFDFGDGDNTINFHRIDESFIKAGDGNNNINSYRMMKSKIDLGDGRNRIGITDLFYSEVNAGNGTNIFTVGSLHAGSSLSVLGGYNRFEIYDISCGRVYTGNGINTILVERDIGLRQNIF